MHGAVFALCDKTNKLVGASLEYNLIFMKSEPLLDLDMTSIKHNVRTANKQRVGGTTTQSNLNNEDHYMA